MPLRADALWVGLGLQSEVASERGTTIHRILGTGHALRLELPVGGILLDAPLPCCLLHGIFESLVHSHDALVSLTKHLTEVPKGSGCLACEDVGDAQLSCQVTPTIAILALVHETQTGMLGGRIPSSTAGRRGCCEKDGDVSRCAHRQKQSVFRDGALTRCESERLSFSRPHRR